MGLKSKLTFHRRLFLLLLLFSWVLVGCFVTFQYRREKHYKAEQLNARLQVLNVRLLNALNTGPDAAGCVATQGGNFEQLRVTIIDTLGQVRYDSASQVDSAELAGNHLLRPEVVAARHNGTGYSIRWSGTTHTDYFYSAMQGDSMIVRTAIPYSLPLREVLAADRDFLWFMLGITLLFSVMGYFGTRRLGHNIVRLRDFAQRAERGEEIGANDLFPHDELGEISTHIVRLYARIQKTAAERDRQHALALHEEQEKIRIKKQLTNNINHELKTPVTAIQGYLETVLENPQMEPALRTSFLEKSLVHTQRLGRLLTDVATITRTEEGGEQISTDTVELNALINEIRSDVETLPAQQQMRLHCDFPYPLTVVGSPSLLGSIFRNLTDNATSYSGGRDIYIRLVDQSPTHYIFSFADNGIGIDEQHLPQIFERFYRIEKGRSRKLGGTGLGLSIVRNAVHFHGGVIEARNRNEGGLEFQFSLRKQT